MEITDRQKSILEKIVSEYISSAIPVSSKYLEAKYDFDICPAMIRIEMEKLTDQGYLYQPFVSSGRVPTDKGYRFVVNQIMEEGIPKNKKTDELSKKIKEKEDLFLLASELSQFLAKASSSIAVLKLMDEDLLVKDGWEEVIVAPEFKNRKTLFDFVRFVDSFDEKIDEVLNKEQEIRVFIGEESPFGSDEFAVISSLIRLPQEKTGIISIIGPKRMPYQKNISLIDSLIKLMEDY